MRWLSRLLVILLAGCAMMQGYPGYRVPRVGDTYWDIESVRGAPSSSVTRYVEGGSYTVCRWKAIERTDIQEYIVMFCDGEAVSVDVISYSAYHRSFRPRFHRR